MNDHETDTFSYFVGRFAGIEADVQDPPSLGPMVGRSAVRPRPARLQISPLLAVVALAMVAGLATLLGSQRSESPSGFPAVGSSQSSATPTVASPAALVPLDPASSPEALDGPCVGHTTMFDRARSTIEQDTAVSSAVVIGTLRKVGTAQWNTPDGHVPDGADVEPSQVMRLIRVEVETVIKGTASELITVWIPGGTIGCNQFSIDGFPTTTLGVRYVFFLDEGQTRANIPGAISAWQMWSIESGYVLSPFDGLVPLPTFVERASSAG